MFSPSREKTEPRMILLLTPSFLSRCGPDGHLDQSHRGWHDEVPRVRRRAFQMACSPGRRERSPCHPGRNSCAERGRVFRLPEVSVAVSRIKTGTTAPGFNGSRTASTGSGARFAAHSKAPALS
jgi:hypothetical protein